MLFRSGTIRVLRAEWELAEAAFHQALLIREQVGDRRGLIESTVSVGQLELLRGHWPAADAAHTRALHIAASIDPGPMTVLAHRSMAVVSSLLGRTARAAAELQSAYTLCQSIPETLEYAPTLLALAELALQQADLPVALTYANQALEAARPVEHVLAAHVMLARIQTLARAHRRARSHVAKALGAAETLASPVWLSRAHLALAGLATQTEAWQSAVTAYEKALRHADAARAPLEQALVRRTFADQLRARGVRPEMGERLRAEADQLLAGLVSRAAPGEARPISAPTAASA